MVLLCYTRPLDRKGHPERRTFSGHGFDDRLSFMSFHYPGNYCQSHPRAFLLLGTEEWHEYPLLNLLRHPLPVVLDLDLDPPLLLRLDDS